MKSDLYRSSALPKQLESYGVGSVLLVYGNPVPENNGIVRITAQHRHGFEVERHEGTRIDRVDGVLEVPRWSVG